MPRITKVSRHAGTPLEAASTAARPTAAPPTMSEPEPMTAPTIVYNAGGQHMTAVRKQIGDHRDSHRREHRLTDRHNRLS